MARPREFDETQVLQRALELFWAQGYEATSVDDVCRVTGLSRSSLYHSFGSKRAVLDATLAVYEDGSARRIAALLDEVRPIQDGLRAFFMGFVDDAVDGDGRRGCFIGNCTGELAGRDPAAADRLTRSLQRIEAVLHTALQRAQADGELAADTDITALARFLMAQAQGLRLVAKARPGRAVLEDIVRVALTSVR